MCPKCKSTDIARFKVDAASHDNSDGPVDIFHCMCVCGEEWVE